MTERLLIPQGSTRLIGYMADRLTPQKRLAGVGGNESVGGARRCSAGHETSPCPESGRWPCRKTPESERQRCKHWAIDAVLD